MSTPIERTQQLEFGTFDEIIDVRSPGEFAADHVPGAINLPVLSDAERAQVGTIYKQVNPFEAKKLGASLISANIAVHLERHFRDKPKTFAPLLYCWRGGQRSGSLAIILSQIGWHVTLLDGGYKRYRRHVQTRLYDQDGPICMPVLIDGLTGTAKTTILTELTRRGRPVIDLEALAAHRGSIFGATPGEQQPSQKLFESTLLTELDAATGADPAAQVLIEAESYRIGDRTVPPRLIAAMEDAPAILIDAPLDARVEFTLETYGYLLADRDRICALLGALTEHRGRAQVARWRDYVARGAFAELVRELLAEHYDPAYETARKKRARTLLGTVSLPRLDAIGISEGADQIEALLKS